MRKPCVVVLAAVLSLACTSVSLPETFEPGPSIASRPSYDALYVVVEPDARPLQGRSRFGTMYLAFIPLVPYGHQQLAPEFGALGGAMKEPEFPREVATTVIKDLRATGIVRWVGYPEDWPIGQSDPARAATLRLTLNEGILHRYVTAYGLSFAGGLLWFVGLPISYGSAEIALTAEVIGQDGASLGRQKFRGSNGAADWLYWPTGPAYTRALPGAYEEISSPLRSFVASALAR